MRQRRHRLVDQSAAIVDAVDGHSLQRWRYRGNLGFHAVDDDSRILAVSHHDHAANRFGSVVIQCTATKIRANLHIGNVADANGNSVTLHDDGVLDVLDRFVFVTARAEEPLAADDELHAGRFDCLSTDVQVRSLDRHRQLVERYVVKAKLVRIDFDLILANVTADRRDLADPFDRLQLVLHNEVLHAAKFCEPHAFIGWL